MRNQDYNHKKNEKRTIEPFFLSGFRKIFSTNNLILKKYC